MHLEHEEKASGLNSFIGLDMAWRIDGNPSGIAVMVGNANHVHLQSISTDVTSMTVKERPGKWAFQVYPHPAMIRLFGLDRIIRYKKGRVAEKRVGLMVLRQHLRKLANGSRGLVASPKLIEVLERDMTILRGKALKRHEDTLDAIFCAYLAWHCWRWGAERNEMFGTFADGYIVVPKA